MYCELAVTVIMGNNSTGITMNVQSISLELHKIERQHTLMCKNHAPFTFICQTHGNSAGKCEYITSLNEVAFLEPLVSKHTLNTHLAEPYQLSV